MAALIVDASPGQVLGRPAFGVSVSKADGRPVSDLDASNFEVRLLGPPTSAGYSSHTWDLAIVLEVGDGCYYVAASQTLPPSSGPPPRVWIFGVSVRRLGPKKGASALPSIDSGRTVVSLTVS